MRNCKHCNEEFIVTTGQRYYCSSNCVDKARYYRNIKSFWSVYYIPDRDYIGVTRNIDARMRNHKTTNYQVWHECNTGGEARQLEREYHSIGYSGLNTGEFKSN